MKILVVGFPRSGTSLTYRIIRDNPDVKHMFFEKWLLLQAKSKSELINKRPVLKDTCGEKVINAKRVIGKIGKSNFNIVDYCLKWNDWFGPEAKIIQIIRHPCDSLNSLFIVKQKYPRGPEFKKVYHEYVNYIPNFFNEILNIPNCLTIKYENLLSSPKQVIKNIYSHCNISSDFIFGEKIKYGRLFNYKRKDLLFEYNPRLEKIIKAFNKVDGPLYEKY
jgi:hypothetical protein